MCICESMLSGPDFLDSVADAEAARDNHVNADIYRQRANQWRKDLADLDQCGGHPGIAAELDEAKRQLADYEARIRRAFLTLNNPAEAA